HDGGHHPVPCRGVWVEEQTVGNTAVGREEVMVRPDAARRRGQIRVSEEAGVEERDRDAAPGVARIRAEALGDGENGSMRGGGVFHAPALSMGAPHSTQNRLPGKSSNWQ